MDDAEKIAIEMTKEEILARIGLYFSLKAKEHGICEADGVQTILGCTKSEAWAIWNLYMKRNYQQFGAEMPQPMCVGCKRTPSQIIEYVVCAKEEGCTPEQYVQTDEGTFNEDNGHFYCTACYLKFKMPKGVAP